MGLAATVPQPATPKPSTTVRPGMSPDQDSASATTAAPVPWVTSQRELEERARPQRTRYVKVRMRPGVWRVALATQLHAATGQAGGPREHLYRVTLQWLAELDTRDGRAERVSDTMSAHRATNTLQFRVLETIAPDGTRRTYARLGPRGQIAVTLALTGSAVMPAAAKCASRPARTTARTSVTRLPARAAAPVRRPSDCGAGER